MRRCRLDGRHPLKLLGAIICMSLSLACAQSDVGIVVEELSSPAVQHCTEPQLTAAKGLLYLSWMRHTGDNQYSFEYAVWENNTWSSARTMQEGNGFFANWADVPSLAVLADGSLLAHWLAKRGEGKYAYDVLLSRSQDGVTWTQPVRVHDDSSEAEHGFVTLLPYEKGAWMAWLDGRDFAGDGHDHGGTGLRARYYDAGQLGEEILLDSRTCDCCPTAAVQAGDGLLVAYRDRSEREVRDIFLVRRDASGRWSDPYPLAHDGWEIAGCPVNGPALDAMGNQVVACWFTMAKDTSAVKVAFSNDAGRSFATPVQVDGGHGLGRTAVVLLPSGDALAVWLEDIPGESSHGASAEIRARRVEPNGRLHEPIVVARTSGERASGFPRVLRIANEVFFAWTESGDVPQVHVARLRLPAHWL